MPPTLPLPSPVRLVDRTSLELLGLIEDTLPPDLRRVPASSRYTVAAQLSRRAGARERALIEAPTVARVLADLGYPKVALKVLDRRLLIENTTVTMLDRGLAREIGAILRVVEQHAQDQCAWEAADLRRLRASAAAEGVARPRPAVS